MDRQLLDSIKKTLSPFDIKGFVDAQKVHNSIVNLQLFTVCNELKVCSVYAFIGFKQDGEGSRESTLFVEVETEAGGNLARDSVDKCGSLWRLRKSNWAIRILNGQRQDEPLIEHGDFNDINRISTFDGRSSAINILHSMQRAIATRISEERSTKNGRECNVESKAFRLGEQRS